MKQRACGESFRFFLVLIGLIYVPTILSAELLKKPPEVPERLAFVRMLDVDSFVESPNRGGYGIQTVRIRTRYLDPDVNAFVGLLTGISHFNQDLRIGNPDAPDTAGLLWNWGADIGLKRDRHLWELDLMGVVAGSRLGPCLGIFGEHNITTQWRFYHRTEISAFTGDAMLDADQGLYWLWRWTGISIGYRWFTSRHMDRSGPHIGVLLRFENPKIPFVFPSLG